MYKDDFVKLLNPPLVPRIGQYICKYGVLRMWKLVSSAFLNHVLLPWRHLDAQIGSPRQNVCEIE